MKLSPVRVFLVIVFVFIGCFGIAFAAAGMLTALPPPAVGGTCGPSTGSETALQALAQPGSIGAGPEPPTSNITAHRQWETFIQQCQTIATRRGLASMAIAVISIVVAGVGLVWVLRRRPSEDADPNDADAGPTDERSVWPDGQEQLVGAGVAPATQWGAGPLQAYPPSPYPYPYPGQPYGVQPPGYPQPGYPQPGYPPQGWPQPGYPPQGYPQPPAYPPQGYPQPPYPPQGYPQPGYQEQGFPQQGWAEQPPTAPQASSQPDIPAEGASAAAAEPGAPSPTTSAWLSGVLDDAPVEPGTDTTPGSTGG